MALQLQSGEGQVCSYCNTVARVLEEFSNIMDVWWVQRNLSTTHLLPAAVWEESDNRGISSTARNSSEMELCMELGVIPGTSQGYSSSCHCPPQPSFHALIPAESSPPTVNLAAISFIPAAELEK